MIATPAFLRAHCLIGGGLFVFTYYCLHDYRLHDVCIG
jgi:hypothetical protein